MSPALAAWRRHPARWINVLRRLREGLPARGGAVSPEVANDLFQAHLAVYHFAARFASGRRVLDLGCGTGYGSAHLLASGASSVLGLDADGPSLAYAQRRFAGPRLHFVRGRAELQGSLTEARRFDLIVAANLLAHLVAPAAALDAAQRVLARQGTLLASVPPIADERVMEQHRASGVHRANLYLWDWESLLRPRFQELRLFRLLPPPGASLDFADPRRSRHAAADFRCEEIPPSELASAGSLSVIFVGSTPRPS
ncbi:MAG TPA: methyltransferase domain-containing protein [Thermoanaerobaculia bacterium]|nr:methyltransferase domain-containing protein [Thermoanaerobaculia bacterium]